MKKIIILLVFVALVCVSKSFATPPTSIDLTYDLSSANLHVDAGHPSSDLNKSYVRLMNVYVNDILISATDYTHQEDAAKFVQDVPLTAQIGDVIKVDLFCSLGGEMAKEIKVTKPKPPQHKAADEADN